MLTTALESQIPTLDSLAGKWLSGDEIVTPPSISNTVGAVASTMNITGFQHANFPPIAQGGEAAVFQLNGKPIEAQSFKWSPYQIERMALTANGLELTSTMRVADGAPIVLIRFQIRNVGTQLVTAKFELKHPAGFRRYDQVWDWTNRNVNVRESFEHETQSHDEVIHDMKTGVVAKITRFPFEPISIRPGAVRVFEIVCSFNNARLEPFPKMFSDAKTCWERRWQEAFTPGNRRYTGNFPILISDNPKLNRLYYLSLVSMLQLERTNYRCSRRFFAASAPFAGCTIESFRDTAPMSMVYCLLDPKGFKENLKRWLTVDRSSHNAFDYVSGRGVGPWAAQNDSALFNSFWNYCAISGDREFLDEQRGKFLDWASSWKGRVAPGEVLPDWGENENILGSLPEYIHQVPSITAAHIGVLNKAAQLVSDSDAAKLRSDAKSLADGLMAQYVIRSGVWQVKHRNGMSVVSRHAYDYGMVGTNMADYLAPETRHELTDFVSRELAADGWIRAMSMSDAAAPLSESPATGARGCATAWVAMAVEAMGRFGQFYEMKDFIEMCEAASWQGPLPTAFELVQMPLTGHWIPRISQHGVDYISSGSAAFAQAVIHGLFGIDFDAHGNVLLDQPTVARPIMAQLLNFRTKDGLRDFHCGLVGVR